MKVVNIIDKENCCGCSACSERCPHQCIIMQKDEQGFLYPHIDESKCVDCGLCSEVCPALHQKDTIKPLHTYVAKNEDKAVRLQSSSGGVFTAMAEMIVHDGGIVFGARFDKEWRIVHSYTEKLDGLAAFRGSKYAQSEMGSCYREAEQFLNEGRKVLFTGTPCQIKGLQTFLHKYYENLVTVAIACHSVPSPMIWKDYLKGLKLRDIKKIDFRNKRISWEQYGLNIDYGQNNTFFQKHDDNAFMQLFLHGLIVRPSCFQCPAKNWNSAADIIIGDCWGLSQVAPSFLNDHLGVSFIACQTEKGERFLKTTHIEAVEVPIEEVEKHNGGLSQLAIQPEEYDSFWQAYKNEDDKTKVLKTFVKPFLPSFSLRLKSFLYGMFRK